MRVIRYLNLFEKITGVRTKNCLSYNNMIIFAVPSQLIPKAIGENGRNVKKIVETLGKRIKIIVLPSGNDDISRFILDLIEPLQFRTIEITNTEIIISANKQSKAYLIGRNKVRFNELNKVLEEYFGKSLRIV